MLRELVHADHFLPPHLLMVVIPMVPFAGAAGSSNQDEAEIAMFEELFLSVNVEQKRGKCEKT